MYGFPAGVAAFMSVRQQDVKVATAFLTGEGTVSLVTGENVLLYAYDAGNYFPSRLGKTNPSSQLLPFIVLPRKLKSVLTQSPLLEPIINEI